MRELMRAHAGEEVVAPDPDALVRAAPLSWRQRLASRVPVRLDPGRRAAIGVGVAVLAAAVVTALWLLAQRPKAVPLSDTVPTIGGAASPVGSAVVPAVVRSTPPSDVVVDVAGKVRHPGLYQLPSGARVDDAVRRAGGPLAGVDLASLNLAARVVDGQQIVVGLPPGAGAGAAGSGPAPGGATAPVNLNAASLDELETLPGVGPVLAQHILDWRTAHGSFASVDQLNDVPGIGDVKFGALHELVTV
jgi:competence protein ComEA